MTFLSCIADAVLYVTVMT